VDSNSKFWQRGQSAGLEKIMTLKNKKKSHFLFKSDFLIFMCKQVIQGDDRE